MVSSILQKLIVDGPPPPLMPSLKEESGSDFVSVHGH